MLKILISSFLILFGQSLFAQSHIPVYWGLEGEELLESLKDEYKPGIILNYSNARDTLFSIIDNQNDSLTCVYTGHTIYLDPDKDPTTAAYMNASSNGINTEHTFPQSMGSEFGNARSDMHHLFPTRTSVNSARGNNAFGEIDDHDTDLWYHLNNSQSEIPFSEEINLYSETSNGIFEPREDHKGDVARAMFYFYTMYQVEADNADADFFEDQRETLCQWHITDEVDQKEWNRNLAIAKYQEGKVNPFIYDCSLATRLYCPTEFCLPTSTDNIESKNILISPNPASHITIIHFDEVKEDYEITLYNTNGQLVRQINPLRNKVKYNLDVSDLHNGLYYINIAHSGNVVSKVLIVR